MLVLINVSCLFSSRTNRYLTRGVGRKRCILTVKIRPLKKEPGEIPMIGSLAIKRPLFRHVLCAHLHVCGVPFMRR